MKSPPARRIVFDTDVLIRAALRPQGAAAAAFGVALRIDRVVLSPELLLELSNKIFDEKFSRYIAWHEAEAFVRPLASKCEIWIVTRHHRICDDPSDDKLFDLADEASASYIVSSDRQVLAVKHFRGCQTVTPEAYLRLPRTG